MKVSVAVITYNQEKTIGQTLDSILMQKGDFELEVVIGEDCSKDGTWRICKEYEERFPDRVRLLPNTQNLGIMGNFARTYCSCNGDFLCDIAGDDYYCDDRALEKQIQYMVQHPSVGVLGANGYRYYVKSGKKVPGLNQAVTEESDKAREFFFSESYPGGVYFKPVGLMIRRELLTQLNFDEMIRRKLPVEDYPMQAILSQHTHFACLPDLLVVYRIYKESATFVCLDDADYLQYHKGLVETRRYLNELFPDDACISEANLKEYLFYKEFLLYLHQLRYKRSKALIAEADSQIKDSIKVRRARFFTKTFFHFLFAHLTKEYKIKRTLDRNASTN